MKYPLHLILLTALLCLTQPALGLVNGNAPDKDDTRFDAVAAFSKTNWLTDNPEDKVVHNWFGNAVLIAPDVVLFAKHLLPNGGNKPVGPNAMMVRFRRHADGSLGSKDAGPNSYHNVPIAKVIPATNTDLALGILAKPVEHIKPVAVRFDEEPITEQACILAAWGSESPWRGNAGPRKGLRFGENTATAKGRSIRILSYQTERRENAKGTQQAYIIDKNAVVNMHDSGGSIFILDKTGTPSLCGIISTYSGGTYLPAAQTEDFQLKAATQGAKALIAASKAAEAKQHEKKE